MSEKKNIGRIIQSIGCNGFAGRRYDLAGSIIEQEADDYIIIRTETGEPLIVFFDKHDDKQQIIDEWCSDQDALY